jgi:hypothetical protein
MSLLENPEKLERLAFSEILILRVTPLLPNPTELAYWRSISDNATCGPWQWTEEKWNARERKNSRYRYVWFLQGPLHPGLVYERGTDEYDYFEVMHLRWSEVKGSTLFNVSPGPEDKEFIAQARTALPRCLDYIDRLHQQIAALKDSRIKRGSGHEGYLQEW